MDCDVEPIVETNAYRILYNKLLESVTYKVIRRCEDDIKYGYYGN
jgi:hypothetical protein